MAENKLTSSLNAEEEINLLEQRIEELKKDVEGMEKYKEYKKMADDMALVFKSFEDAGFSREETMQILKVGTEMNRPKLF